MTSAADPHFPPVVIRASAGTGKTFQLSNRFLALAFSGAQPDHILATTFTRKAAGEILDRVLVRLAEAAGDERECRELAAHVRDPALTQDRSRELLEVLLRTLHRLRVSTLDSFFAQIAGSFSLELGLPPGWRIVDELVDAQLRSEAVHAVLRDDDPGNVLTLLRLLTKGEAVRSVGEQVGRLVGELYSLFLETSSGAWQALGQPRGLGQEELDRAIQELALAPVPGDQRLAKARDADLASARDGDWPNFILGGLAGKIVGGEATYHRKPITGPLLEAYRKLICHARAVLVRPLADQTEATRRLLERFDAEYQRLKLARRALRFDDITRKLAAACGPGALLGSRVEQWSHRLDGDIAHLLVDEFQDTSLPQWNVIRPLAQHVVAGGGGRSFFCVGDVKQAIYGWRGGIAELFDALDDQLPRLAHESLNQSHRSSQVVIDTVNRVFEHIAACPVLEKYPSAVAAWTRNFSRHTTARTKLTGYARLVVAPPSADGLHQEDTTLALAARMIRELTLEAPGHTLGALVRENRAVARLIYELGRVGVEASEEGGNPLTDSPAVVAVLSLLTLADHPDHTVARFHVANSPLGPVVGLDRHDDGPAARRLATDVRRSLLAQGYGPAVYRWAKALAPCVNARDLDRLLQLAALGYRYQPEATLRADGFVSYVAGQRVADPAPADVRVMTIHQAKGLQFDIVVLPQLDKRLVGQVPPVVTGRPGPAQPVDRVARYANKQLQALLPAEIREMFDEHSNYVVSESLCVLYVAMTRAVHALHMVIAPSSENERSLPSEFSGLLRSALAGDRRAEPGTTLFAHGDAHWFEKAAPPSAAAPAAPRPPARRERGPAAPLCVRLAPAGQGRARGLDRQSPSGLEGGSRVNLARRLRLDAAAAMKRGTLFHAWFEQIEWLDDGEPDDDMLRRAAARAGVAGLDLAGGLEQFRAMLARPATRDLLSRRHYHDPAACIFDQSVQRELAGGEPALVVWRERPFAVRDGQAILTGSMDRLVLVYRGDRLLAADLVDFKTDVVPDDDPDALGIAGHYRPQMDAYCRAIARLTGLGPARISARLLFVGPGMVHACAPKD